MESQIYRCVNCQCLFTSSLYRQLCFPCCGDQEKWTLFEKLFAAAIMVGLALAMVWLR